MAMQHAIKTVEDLRWLMAHTGGFRRGYVTDVQMNKRRLFDEESGRDVLADTTVTVVIRYQLRGMVRVARLVMNGVTDFSIFEQEGADCSALSVIQAEHSADRLRFWFDPQGELYVVCEEAQLEEVSAPLLTAPSAELARWTFQGRSGEGPSVSWFLTELDDAGLPCSWVMSKKRRASDSLVRWEGDLTPADDPQSGDRANAVRVLVYGAQDGAGFGVVLRAIGAQDRQVSKVLTVLADRITQQYSGTCLVGTTMIPGKEWEYWRARDGESLR